MPAYFYFWTTDPNGEIINKTKWRKVGVAFYAPAAQAGKTIRLKRAYSKMHGAHFWTDNYAELGSLRIPDFVEQPQNFYDVLPMSERDTPETVTLSRIAVRAAPTRHPVPDHHYWTIHPSEQPIYPHPTYVFDKFIGKVYKSNVKGTVPVYLWIGPAPGKPAPHPGPTSDPLVVSP